MVFKTKATLGALLLSVSVPRAVAFPNQAGHCLTGPVLGEASEGLHGRGGGTPLETMGLALSLDGYVLEPSIPTNVNSSQAYTLTLSGLFKGFLVRLSEKNGASVEGDFVVTDTDVQDCPLCDEFAPLVSGVCHNNNNLKDRVSVDFSHESSGDLLLELTVVVNNTARSKDNWYYSNYTLISTPVLAPTPSPTLSPTPQPTPFPTPSPTMPSPATPAPTMPSPATPAPTMPSPATPAPTMPSPATPAPTTPANDTFVPTANPTTAIPTNTPTADSATTEPPTKEPTTKYGTPAPEPPTKEPTTKYGTPAPSPSPTDDPTNSPTPLPSDMPSVSPTATPSASPTTTPSSMPTFLKEYMIIADLPNRGGNPECLELRKDKIYDQNKFLGKTCDWDNEASGQRFLTGFNDENDIFLLRPKNWPNMCAEVFELRSNAWLHIARCNGSSKQYWKFNLDHYNGDDFYAISPIDDDNFIVTNLGVTIDNGDAAMLKTFEDAVRSNAIRKWKFEQIG